MVLIALIPYTNLTNYTIYRHATTMISHIYMSWIAGSEPCRRGARVLPLADRREDLHRALSTCHAHHRRRVPAQERIPPVSQR